MALSDAPVRVVLFPKMETLAGDMFTYTNNEFGLKARAFEICEGQLSGYVQVAAESVSLGLRRVVGTGNQ